MFGWMLQKKSFWSANLLRLKAGAVEYFFWFLVLTAEWWFLISEEM